MQSNTFSHAFQSATFRVSEFQERSDRLDVYLQSLAQKLNSYEQFSLNNNFTVETTFIPTSGPGSGHGNKLKPGKKTTQPLVLCKRSIVPVKNTNQLSCARAIVTTKAPADEDSRGHTYDNLQGST